MGLFKILSDISDIQIIAQHSLQQIVAVYLADQRTGSVVGRNVGGVFGKDITYQLIDRIVSFFLQCIIYLLYDRVDLIVLLIMDGKDCGRITHEIHPLR